MPSTRSLALALTGCLLVLCHISILRGQWHEWSRRCHDFRDGARIKLAGVQEAVKDAQEHNIDVRDLLLELEPQQKDAERGDKAAEKELHTLVSKYSKMKHEKVEALDTFTITETERLGIVAQVEQLDGVLADLMIAEQEAAKVKLGGRASLAATTTASASETGGREGDAAISASPAVLPVAARQPGRGAAGAKGPAKVKGASAHLKGGKGGRSPAGMGRGARRRRAD